MILHVDLDAFYASVEVRDDPSLRGKPVLVGAPTGRSVVAAASYEARTFGCRSAMPMAEARRRCPQAVIVTPRMSVYARESRKFRSILERYSPHIEPLSIDEAFIDAHGSEKLFGPAREIGAKIRKEVKAELGLTCSVGIAPVKFAAKIASDLCKPDGLREVTADELQTFLAPLPVERLFGVGPKLADKLHRIALRTLAEVAAYPSIALRGHLGDEAGRLQSLARGIDPREVVSDRAAKSIGAEDTFEQDLSDGPDLRHAVMAQAERVAERLREHDLVAAVVVLKLKDPEFQITSRRHTLPQPSADGRVMVDMALKLLSESRLGYGKVRLSGVSVSGLSDASAPRQLTLDAAPQKGDKLMGTLDAIRGRFGTAAIARAELLDVEEREQRRATRRGNSLSQNEEEGEAD